MAVEIDRERVAEIDLTEEDERILDEVWEEESQRA